MAETKKRLPLGLIAIAVAAIALLAWSLAAGLLGHGSGRKVVVREAVPSKGAAFWPLYVASAQGFYAKQGLDVQLQVMDPNITISGLIGGAVEVAYADSSQLLYALDKRADLVAFGLSTSRQPYRLMAASNVKTVAALKGRKIAATSQVDVYTYVIRTILSEAGLNPDKDVTWIYGGNQTRRLALLSAGQVDAGLFSPPADARLKAAGFNGLVFTPDVFSNLALSAETVRRDWGERNGETLRRLLTAETEAIAWLNNPANKAEAIKILMTENGAKPADAEAAYAYFIGQHVWSDPCIDPQGLVNVVKIMRAMDQLKSVTEADAPRFTERKWCAK